MMPKNDLQAISNGSRVVRLVAAMMLAAGLFAAGASTAGAAELCVIDGYSGTPVLTATPSPTTPDTDVEITGTGFGPAGCEAILMVGEVEIGTVIVGDDGSFTFTWHVPADWPLGDAPISAVGQNSVVLASTTVEIVDGSAPTVTAAPSGNGASPGGQGTPPTESGALPKTGSKILPAAIGGLALLAVGAGLVVLATRRRHASEK